MFLETICLLGAAAVLFRCYDPALGATLAACSLWWFVIGLLADILAPLGIFVIAFFGIQAFLTEKPEVETAVGGFLSGYLRSGWASCPENGRNVLLGGARLLAPVAQKGSALAHSAFAVLDVEGAIQKVRSCVYQKPTPPPKKTE